MKELTPQRITRLNSRVERHSSIVVLLTILTIPVFAEDSPFEYGYDRAQELLGKKNWAEAAVILEKIVRTTKGVPEISLEYSKALFHLGRRMDAIEVLKVEALRSKGQAKEQLLSRAGVLAVQFRTHLTFQAYQDGVNAMAQRKFSDAAARLEKAFAAEPDHRDILLRLAQVRVMEGKYELAIRNFEELLKLDPTAPSKIWLGKILIEQGKFKDAVAALRSRDTQNNSYELGVVWWIESLLATGQKAAALQAMEQELKLHPDYVHVLLIYSKLRYSIAGDDPDVLRSIKQDLVGILPKIELLSQSKPKPYGNFDFGFDPRNFTQLKAEAEELSSSVEAKVSYLKN